MLNGWDGSMALMVATAVLLVTLVLFGLSKAQRTAGSGRRKLSSRDADVVPERLAVAPEPPDPQSVAAAVAALRRGCLVAFATETVYGLAADPTVAGAMDRICAAKGRDLSKPVALLAAGIHQVEALGADFGRAGAALAKRFWPGPLTLVLRVPDGSFQGFRVPQHPIPLAVAQHFQQPLLLTSANRSGQPDATTAEQVLTELEGHVAVVLDSGPVLGGVPSTVVKVDGDQLLVLREGAIPFGQLQAVHYAALRSV